MITALSLNNTLNEQTDEGISSLVDTWMFIKDIEFNGERNRGLYIMKARGKGHSNKVREFVINDKGLDLEDVYSGSEGVLTGSAREAHILKEQTGLALHNQAAIRKDREISRQRKVLEAKIAGLQTEFESAEEELNKIYRDEELRIKIQQDAEIEKDEKQLKSKRKK